MLILKPPTDCVMYVSGMGIRPTPTRYAGEYWDRMASDLLCGVADVFQDVGLVMTGETWDADLATVEKAPANRWANLGDSQRRYMSIWHRSEIGWYFIPDSREAVEDVMAWTTPYIREGVATKGPISRAFVGYNHFRNRLDSETLDRSPKAMKEFIEEVCIRPALFTMKWSPATWVFYPGQIGLDQLIKLTDPVVSRVNAVTTD